MDAAVGVGDGVAATLAAAMLTDGAGSACVVPGERRVSQAMTLTSTTTARTRAMTRRGLRIAGSELTEQGYWVVRHMTFDRSCAAEIR